MKNKKTIKQIQLEEIRDLAEIVIGENWKKGLWQFTQKGFGQKIRNQLIRALKRERPSFIKKWKEAINI